MFLFNLFYTNTLYYAYICIFLINYFLYSFESLNIYIYISYVDIEYILSKIISSWSSIENLISFFFLINILIFLIIKKTYIFLHKQYHNFILCISFFYLYYNIIYNEIYFKMLFFNPLLNHTMGAIHPPLIILSIFLIRYYFNTKKNETNKILFFFITISLWTGSIWSASLFGWNGLWMWDPIENISFIYWLWILFLLHKKNNTSNIYMIFYFYMLDFYFFILFKIKITNSIHIFQININQWKINSYPLIYIYMYVNIIIYIIISIQLKKKNIKIKTSDINIYNILYILMFGILIFFFINHVCNISTINIKIVLNIYYLVIYIFMLFIFIFYALKNNSNYYINIIIIITFFINTNIWISLYIIILIILYSKNNNTIKNHFFYFIILYFFIFFFENTKEYYSIYLNSVRYNQISKDLFIYKENNNFIKSIIENINIHTINEITEQNLICNIKKNNTYTFFYKKMYSFINDKNENTFYIQIPLLKSYSINLKEIIIIQTKYLFFIIITLIIYILQNINKMRIFHLK